MTPTRRAGATLRIVVVAALATALSGCLSNVSLGDKPDDDRQRGTLLVDEPGSSDYAINPAGTSIVKSSGFGGTKPRGLVIRSLAGKKFEPLLDGSDHLLAAGAHWMDAKRIAFVDPGKSRDSKRSTLWVGTVDGSATEVPDAVLGGEEWEAWTVREINGVTSDRIYFTAGKAIGSGLDLVSIRPDGSERTVIADLYDKPSRFDIRVSPDGKRAVWTRETASQTSHDRTDVFVGELDGGDAVKLARGKDPAWSPDGKSIVYLATDGRTEEDGLPILSVHTVPADGSAKPKVVPGGYCCWSGPLQWVGKRIVMSDAAYVVGDGRLYAVTLR